MTGDAAPAWLDRQAYPFPPHFIGTPEGRMHYVDQGAGDPVVFVHGNPTWSFEHRRLIAHLSRTHRCVAPDHIGFGLSDKPAAASYAPQMHAANLAALIDQLNLARITLVVHDWGGPIGLSYALAHPDRIARVITYNSWFWSVRGERTFEQFSGLIGGPVGRFLCVNFNFFPTVVMRFGVARPLPAPIRRQYTRVHRTRSSRKGTWVFPRSIIGESAWLDSLWAQRDRAAHLPLLQLWGGRDTAFDAKQAARWQACFANHETHWFGDVGHFTPEELGERANPLVDAFITRTAG